MSTVFLSSPDTQSPVDLPYDPSLTVVESAYPSSRVHQLLAAEESSNRELRAGVDWVIDEVRHLRLRNKSLKENLETAEERLESARQSNRRLEARLSDQRDTIHKLLHHIKSIHANQERAARELQLAVYTAEQNMSQWMAPPGNVAIATDMWNVQSSVTEDSGVAKMD